MVIERGHVVPGEGPAAERSLLTDFRDWYENNYHVKIHTYQIEEFIYDQWMLTPEGEE